MRTEEFTECWHANAPRVLAYATRHVGADEAPEIVAEAFLQAWRRWDDVPDPPVPWLIGTARKIIANQRRGARRRQQLGRRLSFLSDAASPATDAGVLAEEREEALRRLDALTSNDREALLLVAWDGLSIDEASRVTGVRPGTFRARLHRARTCLHAQESALHPRKYARNATEGAS
jgi:RNA polymerase sigma factor (sigma-70 family)